MMRSAAGLIFAGTLSLCASSALWAQAATSAPAKATCANPDALGVARIVQIDTTGGPGFGSEHFKQLDFLRNKEVVLTFDDGPWAVNTPAVLKALADECTQAMFFPIGKHATYYPEILKQVAAAGHTIGSHTWSHANLNDKKLTEQQRRDEIEKGFSAVKWALGAAPSAFFRFPALQHPPETVTYLGTRDVAILSCDVDSFDFKATSPEQVTDTVMKRLEKVGKGIILLHDFNKHTAAALPALLRKLKSGGYKVVQMTGREPSTTIAQYDALILAGAGQPPTPPVAGQRIFQPATVTSTPPASQSATTPRISAAQPDVPVPGIANPLSDRRLALVVGNSAYKIFSPLPNPRNDAADFATTLRGLGFEVILGTNLNRMEMEEALINFGRKARDVDTALVFYAGHGLQHQGINYLAPIDATLTDETDLRKFLNLQDVISDLQGASRVRILIVDACRDNEAVQLLARNLPKSRAAAFARGLAKVEADGTLVAFATQPNRVASDGSGRNSPFTEALLARLTEAGVELRTLMTRVRADVVKTTNGKQRPEVWDSLIGEFAFKPGT